MSILYVFIHITDYFHSVFVFKGPRNLNTMNHYKLNGLKQQKFILSLFWRWEIQNQGVGRTMKALGRDLSLPLLDSGGSWHSVTCDNIILASASVLTWPPSLCMSFHVLSFFLSGHQALLWGSPLNPWWYLLKILK